MTTRTAVAPGKCLAPKTIDIDPYITTWGKMPKGHGTWVFEAIDDEVPTRIHMTGTYAECARRLDAHTDVDWSLLP